VILKIGEAMLGNNINVITTWAKGVDMKGTAASKCGGQTPPRVGHHKGPIPAELPKSNMNSRNDVLGISFRTLSVFTPGLIMGTSVITQQRKCLRQETGVR
jgi:hypothetical protein